MSPAKAQSAAAFPKFSYFGALDLTSLFLLCAFAPLRDMSLRMRSILACRSRVATDLLQLLRRTRMERDDDHLASGRKELVRHAFRNDAPCFIQRTIRRAEAFQPT